MNIISLLSLSLFTILIVGCTGTQKESDAQQLESTQIQTGDTISTNSLLSELIESNILKTNAKDNVVELGDIQFGVNEGKNSLTLITSKSDVISYEAIKSTLNKSYGDCDEDTVESQCLWNRLGENRNYPCVKLRRLHTDEGGWVVMFTR